MAHGDIEKLLTQLARAEGADIEPGLLLRRAERRNKELTASAKAGLLEAIAPAVCKAIVAEIGQGSAWTRSRMDAVRVEGGPADFPRVAFQF